MFLFVLFLTTLVHSLWTGHALLFSKDHVCYQNIGCFYKSSPFDNALGTLPDSPDNIQPRFFLYTRSSPSEGQEVTYQSPVSITSSPFDAQKPTKILIHGYMSSKSEPVIANLSAAFLSNGDYNVIGVDWSQGAHTIYNEAVANTRVTGAVVANLLTMLRDHVNVNVSNVHVVGHSLGAHVAGYVGRRVPGIGRITGLDPAGPMFYKTDPVVRLDPTDALYVDCIHSDAVPFVDAGFGTTQPFGHTDFYPNGGQTQPGCPKPVSTTLEHLLTFHFSAAFNSVSCSHDRAIWYFIESLSGEKCKFTSYPCSSDSDFEAGKCTSCGNQACPIMGFEADESKRRGTFYLKTNEKRPFCKK